MSRTINPQELKSLLENKDVKVIDVRRKDDYAADNSAIPGASWFDPVLNLTRRGSLPARRSSCAHFERWNPRAPLPEVEEFRALQKSGICATHYTDATTRFELPTADLLVQGRHSGHSADQPVAKPDSTCVRLTFETLYKERIGKNAMLQRPTLEGKVRSLGRGEYAHALVVR